jgi:L-arabinokinase
VARLPGNVEPREFEKKFARHLPESMNGAEFLERYGGTSDTVTTLSAIGHMRSVRQQCTRSTRTSASNTFASCCNKAVESRGKDHVGRADVRLARELFSVADSVLRLLNLLVELVRATGVDQGLFGAKITGGRQRRNRRCPRRSRRGGRRWKKSPIDSNH